MLDGFAFGFIHLGTAYFSDSLWKTVGCRYEDICLPAEEIMTLGISPRIAHASEIDFSVSARVVALNVTVTLLPLH